MQKTSRKSQRTIANQEQRAKDRRWNLKWFSACVIMLIFASLLYYGSVNGWMFLDQAHTAVNTMIAMSTSGLVVMLSRIPGIRNKPSEKLENGCLIVIALCVAANVCISYFSDGEPNGYLMTMIVGVATGSVSLLFCSLQIISNRLMPRSNARLEKLLVKNDDTKYIKQRTRPDTH